MPIWVVRVGDQGAAHIQASDVDTDVTVTLTGTADPAKYGPYGRGYVDPMTADAAAETTLLLTPAR